MDTTFNLFSSIQGLDKSKFQSPFEDEIPTHSLLTIKWDQILGPATPEEIREIQTIVGRTFEALTPSQEGPIQSSGLLGNPLCTFSPRILSLFLPASIVESEDGSQYVVPATPDIHTKSLIYPDDLQAPVCESVLPGCLSLFLHSRKETSQPRQFLPLQALEGASNSLMDNRGLSPVSPDSVNKLFISLLGHPKEAFLPEAFDMTRATPPLSQMVILLLSMELVYKRLAEKDDMCRLLKNLIASGPHDSSTHLEALQIDSQVNLNRLVDLVFSSSIDVCLSCCDGRRRLLSAKLNRLLMPVPFCVGDFSKVSPKRKLQPSEQCTLELLCSDAEDGIELALKQRGHSMERNESSWRGSCIRDFFTYQVIQMERNQGIFCLGSEWDDGGPQSSKAIKAALEDFYRKVFTCILEASTSNVQLFAVVESSKGLDKLSVAKKIQLRQMEKGWLGKQEQTSVRGPSKIYLLSTICSNFFPFCNNQKTTKSIGTQLIRIYQKDGFTPGSGDESWTRFRENWKDIFSLREELSKWLIGQTSTSMETMHLYVWVRRGIMSLPTLELINSFGGCTIQIPEEYENAFPCLSRRLFGQKKESKEGKLLELVKAILQLVKETESSVTLNNSTMQWISSLQKPSEPKKTSQSKGNKSKKTSQSTPRDPIQSNNLPSFGLAIVGHQNVSLPQLAYEILRKPSLSLYPNVQRLLEQISKAEEERKAADDLEFSDLLLPARAGRNTNSNHETPWGDFVMGEAKEAKKNARSETDTDPDTDTDADQEHHRDDDEQEMGEKEEVSSDNTEQGNARSPYPNDQHITKVTPESVWPKIRGLVQKNVLGTKFEEVRSLLHNDPYRLLLMMAKKLEAGSKKSKFMKLSKKRPARISVDSADIATESSQKGTGHDQGDGARFGQTQSRNYISCSENAATTHPESKRKREFSDGQQEAIKGHSDLSSDQAEDETLSKLVTAETFVSSNNAAVFSSDEGDTSARNNDDTTGFSSDENETQRNKARRLDSPPTPKNPHSPRRHGANRGKPSSTNRVASTAVKHGVASANEPEKSDETLESVKTSIQDGFSKLGLEKGVVLTSQHRLKLLNLLASIDGAETYANMEFLKAKEAINKPILNEKLKKGNSGTIQGALLNVVSQTFARKLLPQCPYCKKPTEGQHHCPKCQMTICGVSCGSPIPGGPEGYGSPMVCFNCEPSMLSIMGNETPDIVGLYRQASTPNRQGGLHGLLSSQTPTS